MRLGRVWSKDARDTFPPSQGAGVRLKVAIPPPLSIPLLLSSFGITLFDSFSRQSRSSHPSSRSSLLSLSLSREWLLHLTVNLFIPSSPSPRHTQDLC